MPLLEFTLGYSLKPIFINETYISTIEMDDYNSDLVKIFLSNGRSYFVNRNKHVARLINKLEEIKSDD